MDSEAEVVDTITLLPDKSYPRACFGKKDCAAERLSLGPGGNHGLVVTVHSERAVLCREGILLPGKNNPAWEGTAETRRQLAGGGIRSGCWQVCLRWPGQVA